MVLRHRRALRRLLWHPGELGLAQAYVAGELDVEGDLADGLSPVLALGAGAGPRPARAPAGRAATGPDAARLALRLGALGPAPARPRRRRHGCGGGCTARRRDRAAIATTTTCPTTFYALLLDATMAYSCGYWTAPPTRPTAWPTPSATSWT